MTPVTFPAFPNKHRYLFYKDPKPEEFGEMWAAIWDSNAECVVRVNHMNAKLEALYYPEMDSDQRVYKSASLKSEFRIGLAVKETKSNIIYRRLNVTCNGSTREIQQLQVQ